MAAIVKIDFKIGGEDAVLRSFKSISQAAELSARNEARASRTAAGERVRSSGRISAAERDQQREAVRSLDRGMAEQKRATRALETEAVKSLDRELAAVSKVERAKQVARGSAMSKDVEETRRVERRKEEVRATFMARDVETASRAARRKQEALGGSIDKDVRATERAEQRKASLARRSEEREAKKATSATRGFFSDTGQGLSRGFNRGTGVVAAAGGLVTGAIGVSGIEAAVQSRMSLETQAAQLAADVRTGDDKFMDQGALIADAQRTAGQTGVKQEDVMAAMSQAAAQGGGAEGLKAFRGGLAGWGQLSLASGTAIGDLSSVSATMSNNGILDSKKQLEIARSINAAAKTGNVGFREMAGNVMEVAGMHQAMGFKGDAERRMGLASGMIQMAKQGGASSAAEAATSANSFMADLVGDKAKKLLTSKGIKTYETQVGPDGKKTKVARDAEDLTVDLFKAAKGDPEKLGNIFDIRSKKTQSAMAAAWGKDGEAGLRALFKEFTTAKQSDVQVNQEADLQKGTTANKVARAMEDFKTQVGNDLLPALTKLIPEFTKLASIVAELVKAFAESPKEMVAKFVALSTLLGGAQAALGNVIGRLGGTLLDKLMGTKVMTMNVQAAAVNMAGGAAGALAGPLGGGNAAGLNAATFAHVAAAGAGGYLAGSALTGAMDKDLVSANATRQNLGILGMSQASGLGPKSSPEKIAEAKATLEKLRAEQSKGFVGRFGDGVMGGAKGLLSGDVSVGNIMSLAPQVALARGVGNAVLGGNEASKDKTNGMAIADLEAAIKATEVIAALDRVTAATDRTTAAVSAVNLQGPKAPVP